jgi:hypothetical protein
MNEPTDKQLPDALLDEYLKGDSDVSRQYRRLHSAEVPAELDNLVLRQAEAAVKPHLSGRRRPAWIRWSAPLAVAASAVVVLSIVVETGQRDETMVLHAPVAVQAKRERAQNEAPAGAANAPASIAPAEPAAPPAPVYIEPKLAEPPAMEVYVPEFVAPAPAPAAIAATPPAASAPAEADSNANVSSETRQSVSKAAAEAERQLQETSAASVERKATSGATSDSSSAVEITASRQPIRADLRAAPHTYSDPEAWLKDIRQLRLNNKQSEADAEWHRFLIAFPNYKVADHDPARAAKK